MKKAIILGASSGIGKELAGVLSTEGYILGLAARRVHLMEQLARELPSECFVRKIDISCPREAMRILEELLAGSCRHGHGQGKWIVPGANPD
jgi:short-subunit dehydrogenase